MGDIWPLLGGSSSFSLFLPLIIERESFLTRDSTHGDNTTDGTVKTLVSAYTWPDKDDCADNGTAINDERPVDLNGDDRSIDLLDRLML